MKWGSIRTLRFIRLYQMHPCLWNTSSSDYTVRKKREEALDAILAKMNIPKFTQTACKTKIKNIRSQYCHELRRIRVSMKSGGKVHKPTLAWFDTVDRFLRPVVLQRTQDLLNDNKLLCEQSILGNQTTSDVADLEFGEFCKKTMNNKPGESTILKTEEIDVSDMEPETFYEGQTIESCAPSRCDVTGSTSSAFSSNYGLDSEERRKESESLKLLTTTIKQLEDSVVKNAATLSGNEFDVFGQSVAAQLTNMPIEDALQLQMEIQQLITTKRINQLNRAQISRH